MLRYTIIVLLQKNAPKFGKMLMTKKTFQTERVHIIMIHQNDMSEKATITLLNSMKSLKINAMLRNAPTKKSEGLATGKVFQALILLAFQGKNLLDFLIVIEGWICLVKIHIIGFLINLNLLGASFYSIWQHT